MAKDDAVLFTVDASQIIVKLHFAGLQAVRGDASKGNGFIVNTGILDDDPSGTPDKVGKTAFDLKNPSGEYDACWITDFEYEASFLLQNAMTDLFKLRAELYGDKSNLLDTADDKKKERFNLLVKQVKDAFKGHKLAEPADKSFTTEDGLKKINDDVKKNSSVFDASEYNAQLDKKKDEAAKVLDTYMKVFAGAANVKKIDASTVVDMQVSSKIKSVKDAAKYMKNFMIQPISDKERAVLMQDFKRQALGSKDEERKVKCTVRMCFYVQYLLKIEES